MNARNYFACFKKAVTMLQKHIETIKNSIGILDTPNTQDLEEALGKLNALYITTSKSQVHIIEIIEKNKELILSSSTDIAEDIRRNKALIIDLDKLMDIYNNEFLMLDIIGNRQLFYLANKDIISDWGKIQHGNFGFPLIPTNTLYTRHGVPPVPKSPLPKLTKGGNTNQYKEDIKHLRKLLKNKKLTDKQKNNILKRLIVSNQK
tara:strand:- start:107 stop:721 length:615 start_codon:yes stop_codon:yes gene_type:complete